MGNSLSLCNKRRTDRGTQFGSAPVHARAKARNTFVTAVRRVIHLLRLRRKWAAYGKLLQLNPRKDLWTGLVRKSGQLVRVHKAPIGLEAQVKKGNRFPKPKQRALIQQANEALDRQTAVSHNSLPARRRRHDVPELVDFSD